MGIVHFEDAPRRGREIGREEEIFVVLGVIARPDKLEYWDGED